MYDSNRFSQCAGLKTQPAAKLLYCYLLTLAGGRYRSAALSVQKLASALGLSRSATRRNLHRLEKLNRLIITPRYSEDGGRLSNEFIIL